MKHDDTLFADETPIPVPGIQTGTIGTVSLVHWWVTGGEATAFDVLRQGLLQNGVRCDDVSIAGGANMLADLDAMVAAGDIPTGAVMSGYGTHFWASKGVLADLSTEAEEGGWDQNVPDALKRFCKFDGKWIGVPTSLHATNWLWINRRAAQKIGLSAPPRSMEALFGALDHGLVPLAIGGQDWLLATLFDAVVLATNGADFYHDAFMRLDETALISPAMVRAFRNLARLSRYADPDHATCNWNDATAKVVSGEALLEASGDWVRAEFNAAGLKEQTDYWSVRFPSTEGLILYNADIIVMFNVDPARRPAQTILCNTLMDASVQGAFNKAKGSAVPRVDALAPDPSKDRRTTGGDASGAPALIGSMAHGYAQPGELQARYFDIVTQVFEGQLAPEDAPPALLRAFKWG